jgi:uncharacterized protein (TIGR02099 family)
MKGMLVSNRSHSTRARWMKRGKNFIVGLIVVTAVIITLFRALTPWANRHKNEMEHQLTVLLGEPVTIKAMKTSWYWFQPVLKLDEVLVSQQGLPVLQLNQLQVGINLWSSLWHWQVQPGILLIDDLHLTVRQAGAGWHVDGIHQDKKLPAMTTASYAPLARWLLAQQKIIVTNLSASVYLRNGKVIPLHTFTIRATHHSGRYRVNGRAKLGEGVPTALSMMADLSFSSDPLTSAQGTLFFSAKQVQLSAWQSFFSGLPYVVEKGNGGVKVWLDLDHGRVTQLQSTLRAQDAWWHKRGSKAHQRIQQMRANLAWQPTQAGWQWSADHVLIETPQKKWPENAFLIDYKRAENSYRFFVKSLWLEPELMPFVDFPEAMNPLLKMKMKGQFDNSQIGFQDGKINYFLSRFSQLSWGANDAIPGVKNLSGALYWEPSSGRLELDGEDTILTLPHQSPLHLNTLNVALDWAALGQGFRVSLDRLLLDHAHLLLSARGVLDEVSSKSLGIVQLTAEFSAKNAHYWKPYLSPLLLKKPKLETWLRRDVKRITSANGRILLHGALSDFPFDNQPGDFSIVTMLNGVDLSFNPLWPMVHDIDAYLRVNKRELTADVLHADLHDGLIADRVNLNVSELGLNRETLLVHGLIDAPADKMLAYVFVSPLRKHLLKLAMLSVQQPLGLDLALAIPLYPESDEVLVHGAVQFNQNDATIQQGLGSLVLKNVSGTLSFDEHGVMDSVLQAVFLEEPIQLLIHAIHGPTPATQIQVAGEFALALMREQWSFPLFAWLQGRVALDTLITLVDDPKASDHVHVTSSLQGVTVDLPEPFGKTRETIAPLTIDADFNKMQGTHLRMDYDKRVTTDLWFGGNKKAGALQRGLVCLGGACEAPAEHASGAAIVGKLAQVDLSLWQTAFSKLPTKSSDGLDGFSTLDLTLDSVVMLGQKYANMRMVATRLLDKAWSVTLTQEDVAADLHYQRSTNTLTGHVSRVAFVKPVNNHSNNKSPELHPDQIPNLALTIDALTLDKQPVGKVIIKSTSKVGSWHVDECQIESEPYVVQFSGDWLQRGGVNQTNLQATGHLTSVASLLKLWNIPPVVEAREGSFQLKGGWAGDPRDFALKHLTGDLNVEVKNGRITHFDHETEEKLGLGKLLSILSLQTIPRRLKLDFSDLSQPGYSFDKFTGEFVLKKGVMTTENSTIDGPVAYASMKGQLDLDKRLYDLDLHVIPHITASLPVVATLAGGPIAGIATWAASKMLTQGVDKVTGYTYKITGPWLEPVVQQVHIYKKKTL